MNNLNEGMAWGLFPIFFAAGGAELAWRGAAAGVYRLWRDLGFAAGAVIAGALADAYSIGTAIGVIAVVTLASGVDAAVRMQETHPRGAAT